VLLQIYRRHLVRIVVSLAILLVFLAHVAQWIRIDPLIGLENFAYDQRLRLFTKASPDERVVVVDIDERSLEAEGQWPWGRDKLARLVDQLFERYRVGIVGFDVVFAERDESSGLPVLRRLAESEFKDDPRFARRLAELAPSLDYDRLFAEAIEGRPVVLGYFFHDAGPGREKARIGTLPPPTFRPGHFTGRNIAFLKAEGYGANLPELQAAALGAGHFNSVTDPDGVVRRVAMLYEYEGAHYEALSLAVARHALGGAKVVPGYAEGSRAGGDYSGLEWLEIGDRVIPVDQHARTLVPFRGRQGSFPYVSATDVLHGRAEPEQLRERIVLIGTSAPGLLDVRATPVQEVFPGVEIHANLIAGMLDNNIKHNPAYTLGAEFMLASVSGLFMVFLLPLLSPLRGTLATLALLVGVVATNLLVWQGMDLVLPLASGLMLLLVLYLLNTTYALFVETRGKRQLAGLFGQYVPPELVDEMAEDPQAFSLEGESREMTVLFSDVRNFTTISEGLEPRELSQLMNEFLTPLTHIIHEHRGTIDKYMGDAIMAFWGAPLHDPDHAHHALQASLKMIAELRDRQAQYRSRGWPEIRIGIGLNTGVMNVGNMGSEFRMAYTVLGDAVNLGSRLEGLTKAYGVDIIVSETTREHAPEYLYRELDRVRVKGKDRPVTIYEPVGLKEEVEKRTRDEIELYQQALRLYRAQNWDMAELQFLNLQRSAPERSLYRLYAERIVHFRHQPPPADWDGVFTYATK